MSRERSTRNLRFAHEYEFNMGDGSVRVYAGHPGYCQNSELHAMHTFRYAFMLRDGTPVEGSYLCDGEEQEALPSRFIDLPANNGPD
jgi:hypothetical protein